MSVPITDLPVTQRPRERLYALGPQALSDGELLALLLGQGRRGASAVELAFTLLTEFGGVTGLSSARPEELARLGGVGTAKAAAIIAAFQLAARARLGPVPAAPLLRAEDVALAAAPLFAGARVERLLVLVCDTRNR